MVSKTKTPPLPLGAEATTESVGKNIRLTVGLKLSLPYISQHFDIGKQSARSYIVSPMVSGSIDLPLDCDLFRETISLYQRLLPCFGVVMLQEFSRAQSIDSQSPPSSPNMGVVMNARTLLTTLHGPATATTPNGDGQ